MNLNRLEQLLDRAPSKRITVIGDLMLDEFVWGKVGRISPEAPVPVVEVTGESFYPGGAANVARNLREFIDAVSVIGTVGMDSSGSDLLDLLHAQKIETGLVVRDAGFKTKNSWPVDYPSPIRSIHLWRTKRCSPRVKNCYPCGTRKCC